MRSVGDPVFGTYSNSTASLTNTTAQVSVARFPTIANIPDIPLHGRLRRTIGGNIQGVVVDTGNSECRPAKGHDLVDRPRSGTDLPPPGFRGSVTLFNNKLRGGITSPCAPGCIPNNGALELFC